MTKIHHPSSRADRLRLKHIKDEKAKNKDRAGHVRHKLLVERTKEEELEHELRAVVDNFA